MTTAPRAYMFIALAAIDNFSSKESRRVAARRLISIKTLLKFMEL
jgi:hypothetical protein